MAITCLSYLGVNSEHSEDWLDFATKILGMQVTEKCKNSYSFRMDNQKQRLSVNYEKDSYKFFIGLEVDSLNDLESYAERLERAGVLVYQGGPNIADRRFVESLIYFHDPQNNRIELVYKPMLDETTFVPGRPILGFKTDVLGMGHVVLQTDNLAVLLPFYRDLLGFCVSDFTLTPVTAYFLHINNRHHSFALINTGKTGLHHFMVEYNHLDDVGQGYDLLECKENSIAYTLGRHTNDYMTSFYTYSPSGFLVEVGWGGRIIDPRNWVPKEMDIGPSFWGHERLHLPDELRRKFRKKRLETAAKGMKSPPIVNCPWLYS